ncbi:Protein of unknown function [Pyronema omphalodes CBS 100304]|uniref:Uncharacterized protein n=1 Tax=Pyronema omphalodes (strain CBS 100304) TaxID=1076935 RepID=U4L7S9_PYROM|nr:Protein of unknown function [Pyronema omphalodes CBS 100304]
MEDLTIKFLLVFITYVSVVIVKNISFALYIIWDIRDGCNWHAKWNTVDFCSKYCERANPLIITTLAISSLAAYMTGAMDLGYDIACMLLILWNVGETVFCRLRMQLHKPTLNHGDVSHYTELRNRRAVSV